MSAAIAGSASGSMTRQKILKYPAPSSFAASSKSFGIVRKYWRMKKRLVAVTRLIRM